MNLFWINIVVSLCFAAVLINAADEHRPKIKKDARGKRNLEYSIAHHYPIGSTYRLERRISTIPQAPRYSTSYFHGPRVYNPYNHKRPHTLPAPPYAVQMEPLVHYSQRDPLYDPKLSSIANVHNDLAKPDDLATDNNHLNEHIQNHPHIVERPIYIREPEPIIEIIIKESNVTLPPESVVPVTPAPKKKEEVQVFYVKYKKNPHGQGKDSIIYDKPVPAISPPVKDDEEEEKVSEHVEYPQPEYVTSAPPPSTTLRAIIKPESEVFHSDDGIHVTFGSEHAQKKEYDDQNEESAPRPAISFPQGRQLSLGGPPQKRTPTNFPPRFPPPNFRTFNNHNPFGRGPSNKDLSQPNRPPPNFNSRPPSGPQFGSQLQPQPTQHVFNQRQPVPYRPFEQIRPQSPNTNQPFPRPQTHFPVQQQLPLPQQDFTFNHQAAHRQQQQQINTQNTPPHQIQSQIHAFHQQTFTQHHQQFQTQKQPHPSNNGNVQFPQANIQQFPQQNQFPSQNHSPQHHQQNQQHNQQFSQQNIQFPQQNQQVGPQNHQLPQQNHQSAQNNHQLVQQNHQFVQQNHQLAQQNHQLPNQQQLESNHQVPNQQQLPQFAQQNQFSQGNVFQQTRPNFGQQQQQQQQQFAVQQQAQVNFQQQNAQFNHFQSNTHQNQQHPQSIIPPGGELIASVPKYEQHISVPTFLQQSSQQTSSQQQQQQLQQQLLQQEQQQQQQQQHQQESPQVQQQHQQVFSHGNSLTGEDYRQQAQDQFGSSQSISVDQNIDQFHQGSFGAKQNGPAFQTTQRSFTYQNTPSTTVTTTTRPTTSTTTTTTTEPPSAKKEDKNPLNIQLPDEVPDDLREQLLSSGILANAQISVLDYDKVGDIPLSALPPDQLANFYNAGGASQIASSSRVVESVVDNAGNPIKSVEDEPVAAGSDVDEVKVNQPVEMKVVHFDPQTEHGKKVKDTYVKDDATQVEPVVLSDQSYTKYLPLKVSGEQFPIPDVPELKGKVINSVVVLAPVDYAATSKRTVRAAKKSVEEIKFISGPELKQLLDRPTKENFQKWLDHENKTASEKQSVILLVTGSDVENNKEIFMYDISTKTVNKLNGELSTAFVDAAETNTNEEKLSEEAAEASNIVETKLPAPEQSNRLQQTDSLDDLDEAASEYVESKVPIIDPTESDLKPDGSERFEKFVDISGLEVKPNADLILAATNTDELKRN